MASKPLPSVMGTEPALPIPDHLEFTAQWFPKGASAATHCDVARDGQLASQLSGHKAHFSENLRVLDLIRNHTGFDHSQIDRFTTAAVSSGNTGTIVFFTVGEQISLGEHFDAGRFPITPLTHRFHNKQIYQLPADERPLGLYSSEGKHFILGDWTAFKNTLLGNDGNRNEITKILSVQAAPLTLCSNPRTAGKRFAKDAPFGTVISIDFQGGQLAFLMQEEQPTPDLASKRVARMKTEMPKAFETAYGLRTKDGVRYIFESDGRHVTLAMQTTVSGSRRLLEHLFGELTPSDTLEFANAHALQATILFDAAKVAGISTARLKSPETIVASLCVGLESEHGQRFQLPFLTGIEQDRVAGRLVLEVGNLGLAPLAEVVVDAEPPPDELEIRRLAQQVATLSMSAAAAESPELKALGTTEAIVEALCTSGLRGGPAYRDERFKGPELSPAERERVVELLVQSEGYLRYKPH